MSQDFTFIAKKNILILRISILIFSILFLVLFSVLLYLYFGQIKNQNIISDIRIAFIKKDYSKVIESSKKLNNNIIGNEDKYVIAISTVMIEPLTNEQKNELTKNKITLQTNDTYLSYWVFIAQQKIDEALDVASYLDDPELIMYGYSKKIDEIQSNPSYSSDERTSKINEYKAKLEEMKKKYNLTPKTNG